MFCFFSLASLISLDMFVFSREGSDEIELVFIYIPYKTQGASGFYID